MKQSKSLGLIGIGAGVILISILLMTGTVSAWSDTFQNHPGNDLTIESNDTGVSWEKDTAYNGDVSILEGDYCDEYVLQLSTYPSPAGATDVAGLKSTKPVYMNYLSYRGEGEATSYGVSEYVYFSFYNISNGLIDTSNNLGYTTLFEDGVHIELIKSGSTIALYRDGTYVYDIGGTYGEDIYYFKIQIQGSRPAGSSGSYWVRFDDISMEGDVLGTIPHDWYVLRNWDNPSLSGLYNGTDTKKVDYPFHTSFTSEDYIGGGDNNPPADNVLTIYLRTGEVVNTTNITAPSCGIISYNLSSMFFHDDETQDLYGTYIQKLMRGSNMLAYDILHVNYCKYGRQTGVLSIEQDSYAAGEIAHINTTITAPDYDIYSYRVEVRDLSSDLIEQWTVTSSPNTINWDTTGLDSGVYYALFIVKNKASGREVELDFDFVTINEGVYVRGYAYDAEDGSVLSGVLIKGVQGATIYQTSSDGTGFYDLGVISKDIDTDFNATKTNYVFNDFTFKPIINGVHEIDVFLLPDSAHISYSAKAILGLVQEYPFYQEAPNLTVHIWNASWSDTYTTTNTGFYRFNNLSEDVYNLNVTGDGYEFPSTVEINTTGVDLTYYYFLIQPLYNLTVYVKDKETAEMLSTFDAILNEGTKKSTTSGFIKFEGVKWGLHRLEGYANNYYGTVEYVYVGQDTSESLYLIKMDEGGGPGVSYASHKVKFEVFKNIWFFINEPVLGVNITVYKMSNESSIFKSGVTGTDGAVVFELLEDIRYKITFSKDSWSDELIIYPKDEKYTVYVFDIDIVPDPGETLHGGVSRTFSTEEIDSTHRYLNFSYDDSLNQTTQLGFYVYNKTGNTKTLLHSETLSDTSVHNFSYTVTPWKGEIFYIKYNATHTKFGDIGRIKVYEFRVDYQVSLGLEDFGQEKYYSWIALALIFLVGSLFSFTTTKYGAILIPGLAGGLWWAGWLSGDQFLITIPVALVLGVLFYMSEKEREVVHG